MRNQTTIWLQTHLNALTKSSNCPNLWVKLNETALDFTDKENKPDRDDVGEEQKEAEDLEIPATSEVLQSHHDQWHHHQSTKQDLRQTVHFQVKQANLQQHVPYRMSVTTQMSKILLTLWYCLFYLMSWVGGVHYTPKLFTGVNHHPNHCALD